MTRPTIAAIGIGALAAAFAMGYLAHRPAVITKEVTAHAESHATEAAHVQTSTTTVANVTGVVHWRERRVYLPGQIIVEREGERQDASTTKVDAKVATESKRDVVIKTERVEVIRAVPVLKGWALSGYGGLTFDAGRVYGGRIERRILGPWWLGVQADNRAVMLTAKVEWE